MTKNTRIVLVWLACLLLAAPASAADVTPAMLLPENPRVTVGELLEQVLPGLVPHEAGMRGRLRGNFRHVAGIEAASSLPEQIHVGRIDLLSFEAAGAPHLLLFVPIISWPEFSEEGALVAAFDTGKRPRLLDVVDVGLDRFTNLFETPLLRIGNDDQAVLLTSAHYNSSQSYAQTQMLALRDRRLELLATFFAYGESTCSYQQSESLAFAALPGSDAPYWRFKASIRRGVAEMSGDTCEPPRPEDFSYATHSAIYSWDIASDSFIADSSALEDLAESNRMRF